MKVYRGELSQDIKQFISENQDAVRLVLDKAERGLGRVSKGIYTIEDSVSEYNAGITKEEIKAWVWYRRKQGIPMYSWKKYFVDAGIKELTDWVKNGVLFVENGNYVPYPMFTFGNIYEKLSNLEDDKSEIIENYGVSVYENHLKILTEAKPKVISIQNPIKGERPIILAISKFAKRFKIKSLRPNSGTILQDENTLLEAYKSWLYNLPDEEINKSNSRYIINYYLNGASQPRSIDKIEWRTILKNSRDEGERLFQVFLHEALERNDQQKIDAEYNRKYNATAPLRYDKVPIGVEVSKTFHGNNLEIRPAQREGVAFMELLGSGVIAYDVGVGKTITAILEVASAIKNGKCKRPLIAVPNPTYKNWIKEMLGFNDKNGILTGTGITLNEWYNLGKPIQKKIDLEKEVPENSITLVTYEGFQSIGFSEETETEHFDELSAILAQEDDKSERDREKDYEKYREIIGVGQKGTIADIDILGFDYLVIDEAHNFKNVFAGVKKDDEDEKKRFHIKGGKPSSRGIKAFFICNYIQRRFGRNVMLLTATPFTNSPLEIYSMLSLVAYDYMKKNNIYNIRSFFEQYISETSEYVVARNGEIKLNTVVRSFNNRISLQKLIHSHINFKTGEEANIPRPCKVNLPRTTFKNKDGELEKLPIEKQVTTYLKLTDEQRAHQDWINGEASKPVSKDDLGRTFKLMAASQNNALSPFLFTKEQPNGYLDFVESSPKIKYTLDCIATVKKWHEDRGEEISGQVIYIDRAKDYFMYIKQYLQEVLGFKTNIPLPSNARVKTDEVEIITGDVSGKKKEKIKNAFNEGSCKVIIGTSTIKEGINLQEKSTCLYNLYPNWNPTDIRQLEGRIWRQKNKNGYVRIVMPLMENSMDVFVFQKLEEKTSRINDLWSKADRGNVLDEESLDPNEVKFALVTDLGVLTRFEIGQIREDLNMKQNVLKANIQALNDYSDLKTSYTRYREQVYTKLESYASRFGNIEIGYHKENGYLYYANMANYDLEKLTKEIQRRYELVDKYVTKVREFLNSSNQQDTELVAAFSAALRATGNSISYNYEFEQFKDTLSRYGKIRRTIFDQRGYSEDTDIDRIKEDLEAELEHIENELEEVRSEEFYEKIFNKIGNEKEKMNIKGGSLYDKVNEFASLNHLMSYKFKDVDHTTCAIPESEHKAEVKKPSKDDADIIKIKELEAEALALELELELELELA